MYAQKTYAQNDDTVHDSSQTAYISSCGIDHNLYRTAGRFPTRPNPERPRGSGFMTN